MSAPEPDVARPQLLTAGLLTCLVGIYLVVNPLAVWPWVEPKLLAMAVGSMLIVASGLPIPRRLSWFTGAWVGACLISALFGVNIMRSITGREGDGNGFIMVFLAGYLLLVGAALPRSVIERIPRWLSNLGLAVAAIAVVAWIPGAPIDHLWNRLYIVLTWNGHGSTLGNSLFMIGVLSVSLAATLQRREELGMIRFVGAVALLTFAIGLARQESSIILCVIVIAIWAWRDRPGATAILTVACVTTLIVGVLYVTTRGYTPVTQSSPGTNALDKGIVADPGSSFRQRGILWSASIQGGLRRPITGWGFGNSAGPYLHVFTPEQVRSQERLWGDGHNAFFHLFMTTGFLGLVTFLALLWQILRHLFRTPPELTWAMASVVALGVMLLYEPFALQLVPLAFLLSGVAIARAQPEESKAVKRRHASTDQAVRGGVAVALAGCILLTTMGALASMWHLSGVMNSSESTLRTAVGLAPWRVETREALSLLLAAKYAGIDAVKSNEALSIEEEIVTADPWDPTVRVAAAQVAWRLEQRDLATWILRDQLHYFPSDRYWIDKQIEAKNLPYVELDAEPSDPAPTPSPSPSTTNP